MIFLMSIRTYCLREISFCETTNLLVNWTPPLSTLICNPGSFLKLMKIRNIFSEIERPNRAIRLAAILLAIYNLLRLLSVIAAPYPIDHITNIENKISLSQYQTAFQNYIKEESDRLQIPADTVKISIIYYGCLSAGYVIFSLFLGMRRKFARYLIVCLIVVEIGMDMVAGITYRILPSKISIITAILLLLFLFSHTIAKEFK